MSHSAVNEKIALIHDQTLRLLDSLGLPPLPHHYKKYFDSLIAQSNDQELLALQDNYENTIISDETLTQYLDLAHRSIESFVEAHADISHVAELQENYISKAS